MFIIYWTFAFVVIVAANTFWMTLEFIGITAVFISKWCGLLTAETFVIIVPFLLITTVQWRGTAGLLQALTFESVFEGVIFTAGILIKRLVTLAFLS